MSNVKVYSTPSCPWCSRAKDYLRQKKVVFEDIDVSVNKKAAQEMITKSGQMGVPVLDINGRIIIGFDQESINKALEVS